MDRPIRIVVGEGRTAQRGLLRFVLEGEGFEVVGETSSTADLPVVITSQQPDVVVLDDGIGVTAVSMVHDIAPDAKVVLVWPAAVVPIGGDARVEPAKILNDLGPAVEHVAVAAGIGMTRPDWIDKVKKDPATLRSKLAKTGGIAAIGGAAAKRRNVTRPQRRSRRLHPSTQEAPADAARRDEDAAVVVLPVAAAGAATAAAEPILDISGTDGPVDAAPDEVEEPSEWNRRLGTLAMSGAAAVSALILALALGGGRIPASFLRGGGNVPLGVPGFFQPGATPDGGGSFGFGGLGGSGYDPRGSAAAYEARSAAAAAAAAARNAAGVDAAARILAPEDTGSGGEVTEPPTGGSDDGGGPNDGGSGGGDGGDNGGGGAGGHGNGGGNGAGADSALPGKSAEHNPHGGPPGQMGLTPAHGPGLGAANGQVEGKEHPHKA
jgi:hypothetical protein